MKKKSVSRFELDEQGIPWVNYGTIDGSVIGKQRNPVTISQKAIIYYLDYSQNGSSITKQHLINNADWLVNNAKKYDNYLMLEYNFPWPTYNLPAPWRSGMAQGEAIQALIKAHEITSNQKYLDAAKLLLNSFFIEVSNGGITLKSSDEEWWYEEYAQEKGQVSRVLNGMMVAVLDIYEYFKYTKDQDAKSLFDKGITSLTRNLSGYDFNGYSYYDILKRPAGEKYHGVHIRLTKQLHDITNQQVLKDYHEKWKSYEPPVRSRISNLVRRVITKL